MLRMILADDEPAITKGISVLFDWARLGIEVIGTYENGERALQAILAEAPDIAILDIAMPGKTGLEILQEIKANSMQTSVIFLSGFQEFSFAQSALHHGAKDYLLKPVNKESLLLAVRNCISQTQTGVGLTSESAVEDAFLPKDLVKKLAGMDSQGYTLCALTLLGTESSSEMERQLCQLSVYSEVVQALEGQNLGLAFQRDKMIWLILTDPAGLEAKATLFGLQQRFLPNTQLGFVHGKRTESIGTIQNSALEVEDMLGYFFFYEHLPSWILHAGEPVFPPLYNSEKLGELRDKIITVLFEQNVDQLQRLLDIFLDAVCSVSEGKSDTAVYFLLMCIRAAEERFLELNAPLTYSSVVEVMEQTRTMVSYGQLEDVFRKTMWKYFQEVTDITRDNDKTDINEAKNFIKEHYAENLSLAVVAKHIHMNPFYFSSFFKKQTGENYKDYLNDVRMRHGMELLLMSDKKIYEIAEAVGFKDYRYFTDLFSRRYGKTPMAYRKEVLEGRREDV